MKSLLQTIILGIVLAALVTLVNSFYIVDETEQVVITQFGEPIGTPIKKAGLNIKIPFIQNVNRFDQRILEWDGEPNQIPTLDKRYIWVDVTARWRIVDALQFMKALGSEAVAQARLDDILDAAARDAVSSHNLVEMIRNTNELLERDQAREKIADDIDTINASDEALELVRYGREKLTRDILKRASEKLGEFGIELVDIRIRRINYVQDVLRKVFERMISERKRAAEQYRALGQGKRAEIEGKMARELEEIRSEAYRKAQETIGKADAQAITIYADAYNRDAAFYSFLKTMETYRETIDGNTILILSTESDVFKYLKGVHKTP